MSGFVGIVNVDGAPVDRSLLSRITHAMAYCGPDRQEVWHDGRAGLGHALLAAAPEPAEDGRQPCSLDGRTWVVSDARIDGQPGDEPDSHEILRAYAKWGESCVEHLIGDFSFVIWDAAERRLFGARDHFGVIPMYYARAGRDLVIGNVLRPLRLHPAVSDELDERVVGDFLLFGRNMDPAATAFADIRALPPGHAVTWEDGTLRIRRYWAPPEVAREVRLERPEEHVERFAELFERAVRDRLRSNRVGTHLSGGMDSTSIAATAHRVLERRGGDFDLRAYTIVSNGLLVEEEGRYANEVAARLDIPVEQLVVDDVMTGRRDSGDAWVFPEPGPIRERSGHYEVARRVTSFSRSLLAGIGGDPLLWAPPAWPSDAAQWRDHASFALTAIRDGRVPRLGIRTALRRRRDERRRRASHLPAWIRPDFADRVLLGERVRAVEGEWEAASPQRVLLHPLWATIFAYAHPGANGLPLRSLFPFFDLRLAECIWETPAYPWRKDKRILRAAMSGMLPESVLQRPKTPLYVDRRGNERGDPRFRIALVPETQRWRAGLLSGRIGEYVDVERLRAVIESPVPGRMASRFESCFTLAHWLQSEIDVPADLHSRKEPLDAGDPTRA